MDVYIANWLGGFLCGGIVGFWLGNHFCRLAKRKEPTVNVNAKTHRYRGPYGEPLWSWEDAHSRTECCEFYERTAKENEEKKKAESEKVIAEIKIRQKAKWDALPLFSGVYGPANCPACFSSCIKTARIVGVDSYLPKGNIIGFSFGDRVVMHRVCAICKNAWYEKPLDAKEGA